MNYLKKNIATNIPATTTQKAPNAMDSDKRILLDLEISGKWL
ncbi:MAG: hypothetical protein AB1444_12750 [Spirochaetota bacterium]